MNDQPKPTTRDYISATGIEPPIPASRNRDRTTGDGQPTTGEWTPAFVMEVREGCEIAGVDFDTKIANGHNAEVAAERERLAQAYQDNQNLRDALAKVKAGK